MFLNCFFLIFSYWWNAPRASVKLLELGVRTTGGLFLGVWYAKGIDFRRFSYTKPSDLRRNFRPTRSDEDAQVVLVNITKDRLHIYNAVDYYTSRGSYVFTCVVDLKVIAIGLCNAE